MMITGLFVLQRALNASEKENVRVEAEDLANKALQREYPVEYELHVNRDFLEPWEEMTRRTQQRFWLLLQRSTNTNVNLDTLNGPARFQEYKRVVDLAKVRIKEVIAAFTAEKWWDCATERLYSSPASTRTRPRTASTDDSSSSESSSDHGEPPASSASTSRMSAALAEIDWSTVETQEQAASTPGW